MKGKLAEITRKVHEVFSGRKLNLSVAESCTGGFVSSCIASLPGASAFFSAGVVTYSEEAKRDILGVSADTIGRYGVVSDATAREMAERMRALAKTDYSLSTTGNLGPDVQEGKERGLVYIAACRSGRTVSRELRLKGNREDNRQAATVSAFSLLLELLEEDEKGP